MFIWFDVWKIQKEKKSYKSYFKTSSKQRRARSMYEIWDHAKVVIIAYLYHRQPKLLSGLSSRNWHCPCHKPECTLSERLVQIRSEKKKCAPAVVRTHGPKFKVSWLPGICIKKTILPDIMLSRPYVTYRMKISASSALSGITPISLAVKEGGNSRILGPLNNYPAPLGYRARLLIWRTK